MRQKMRFTKSGFRMPTFSRFQAAVFQLIKSRQRDWNACNRYGQDKLASLSTNKIPATGLKPSRNFDRRWERSKLSTNKIPATGLKPLSRFDSKPTENFQLIKSRQRDWNRWLRLALEPEKPRYFQLIKSRQRDWNFSSSSVFPSRGILSTNKIPATGLKPVNIHVRY